MKHTTKLLVTAIIIIFSLGGCLGPKQPDRKIEYYTLEYDPPEDRGFTPLPFILKINRFQVAPLYNSNRIVFREKQYKRDVYAYHKWRGNPGDIIPYFLTRDLQQSSVFKGVFALESALPYTHAIEGVVEEFFEQDNEDSWKAVLGLSITLIAANETDITKTLLFQKKYLEMEACRQKNPRSLAEAMSTAMTRISEMILSDIHDHLSVASSNMGENDPGPK